ncbi:MAG: ABC transporter ATP-binding protein [Caldilineaceae bacterium]
MNQSTNLTLAQYRGLLIHYIKPLWRRTLLLAFILLASLSLDLYAPQVMRKFIDATLAGAALNRLVDLALIFLAVTVANQLVSVSEASLAADVSLQATNQLRTDLTRHCLALDLTFHNAHTPGELIERVDGDVGTLANFFSRFALHVLSSTLLLVGVLTLFFVIDTQIGLTMLCFSGGFLWFLHKQHQFSVPHWVTIRQLWAATYGFLEERLSGLEDIRANGAMDYVMRRYFEQGRRLFYGMMRAFLLVTGVSNLNGILLAAGAALALGLGIYRYTLGELSLGTVYLIFSYTQLLRRPLERILDQIRDLGQVAGSIVRIQSLFNTQSRISDGPGATLAAGAPAVAFDQVSFGYHANQLVLDNLSFALSPGAVLGLIGRTGSGKTTLSRLLFRLYDPTVGVVKLGGVDLRQAKVADLRRHVALVPQEVHLFHASLRHNLTLFDESIPDARILEALGELELIDWYRMLPNGLATVLAAGGGGLSAGEAQLLAVARVFLQDPGLVILDEASARLDPATERRLSRAIDRLLAGRTAIIIAHRLATLQRADQIMILADGRMAEYGPRETLARNPASRYAQLLQTGLYRSCE